MLLFYLRKESKTGPTRTKLFFLLKKGHRWIFLHIWNPESQAGINEKEERENQRERDRAAALHVAGGEFEPAPWRASQMQIGSHKFSWIDSMWDSVMLMCLSNAQWPSGHSPLIGPLCENIKQSGVSAKCIIMALIYFPAIDSTRFEILWCWYVCRMYGGHQSTILELAHDVRFKQSAVSAKCTYL